MKNKVLCKNLNRLPCKNCNEIHEFYTRDCKPVLFNIDHIKDVGFKTVELVAAE